MELSVAPYGGTWDDATCPGTSPTLGTTSQPESVEVSSLRGLERGSLGGPEPSGVVGRRPVTGWFSYMVEDVIAITKNSRLRESVGSGRFRRSLDRGRGPAVIGE